MTRPLITKKIFTPLEAARFFVCLIYLGLKQQGKPANQPLKLAFFDEALFGCEVEGKLPLRLNLDFVDSPLGKRCSQMEEIFYWAKHAGIANTDGNSYTTWHTEIYDELVNHFLRQLDLERDEVINYGVHFLEKLDKAIEAYEARQRQVEGI